MNEMQSKQFNEFDTDSPIFMGAKRNPIGCKVGLFGVPYDGTTSFRPGTRFGPDAIRTVSKGLETYCPEIKLDLEDLNYVDFGSLDIPFGAPEPVIKKVKIAARKLLKIDLKPLMLGGEHSITLGNISAIIETYPELIMIQLDAHADLRDEWLGNRHNHACAMRRCLEVLPSNKLFQLAIRSGTKEEFKELSIKKRLINQTPGGSANELDKVLKPFKGCPLYITVDLDWFDPSLVSGTGTPEPGGFFWKDFSAVIEVLRHHHLVGGDVVELSPDLDHSGVSSVLAAKVTRSLIMLMSI